MRFNVGDSVVIRGREVPFRIVEVDGSSYRIESYGGGSSGPWVDSELEPSPAPFVSRREKQMAAAKLRGPHTLRRALHKAQEGAYYQIVTDGRISIREQHEGGYVVSTTDGSYQVSGENPFGMVMRVAVMLYSHPALPIWLVLEDE